MAHRGSLPMDFATDISIGEIETSRPRSVVETDGNSHHDTLSTNRIPAASSKSPGHSRESSRRGSGLTSDKTPPPPPPLVAPVLAQVLHSGLLRKKGALATSKFYVLTSEVFAFFGSEKEFKKGVSGTVTLLSTMSSITSDKEVVNYTVKSTAKPVQLLAASEAEASVWCEHLNDAWTAGGNDDTQRPNSGPDSEDDDLKTGIQDEEGLFSMTLEELPETDGFHKKSRKKTHHKNNQSMEGSVNHRRARSKKPHVSRKKDVVVSTSDDIAFEADFETAFDPGFDNFNDPAQAAEKRNSLSSTVPRASLSTSTSTRTSISVSMSSSFPNIPSQTNLSPLPSPSASECTSDPPSNEELPSGANLSTASATTTASVTTALTTNTRTSTTLSPPAVLSPKQQNSSSSSSLHSTPPSPPTRKQSTSDQQQQQQELQAHTSPLKPTDLDFADFADFSVEEGTRPSSFSTSSTTTSTFHTIASTTSPSASCSGTTSSLSPSSSFTSALPSPKASSSSFASPSPKSSPKASSSAVVSPPVSPPVSPSAAASSIATFDTLSGRTNSIALSSRKARSGLHTSSVHSSPTAHAVPHVGLTSHQKTGSKEFADFEPISRPRQNSFVKFDFMNTFLQTSGLNAPNWDVIMETDFEEVEEVDDDGYFRVGGGLRPSSRSTTIAEPPPSQPQGKQGLRLSNVGLAPGTGGFTLQDVLDDAEGAELLRKYAVETFDTENLDFLEEVQAYQKLVENGKTVDALKQGKSICEQFVSEAGGKSLNLNSKQRTQQLGLWKGLSPDFLEGTEFDVSVKEVMFLLATNQFLRFKKTAPCAVWEKKVALRNVEQQKAAALAASSKFAEKRSSELFASTGHSNIKASVEGDAMKVQGAGGSGKHSVIAHHTHKRAPTTTDPLSSKQPSSSSSSSSSSSTSTTTSTASSTASPLVLSPASLDSSDFDGFEDMKAPSAPLAAAVSKAPISPLLAPLSPLPENAGRVTAADMDAFFSSFEQTKKEHVSTSATSGAGAISENGKEELLLFLQEIELVSVHAILVANSVKDVQMLAASQMADLKRWGISSSHSIKLLKASRAKSAPAKSLSNYSAPSSPLTTSSSFSLLDSNSKPPPSSPVRSDSSLASDPQLASVMGNIDWMKELGMKPVDKNEKKVEGRFSSLRRSLLGKKPNAVSVPATTASAPPLSTSKQPPPPPLLPHSLSSLGSSGASSTQLTAGPLSPPSSEDVLVKPYLDALGLADQSTLEALEIHGIRTVVHLSSCPVGKLKAIGIPMGPAVKIVRSFQC